MTSHGAKLANTTAILAVAIALTGCAGKQSPVAKLEDAVHTRAFLEKAAEANAEKRAQYADVAESARAAGETDLAVQYALRAVAADPADFQARLTLAQAYFESGQFVSAGQAFDDLIAMRPRNDAVRFGRALVHLAAGEERLARALLAQLEAAAARAGDVGLAYVLLGEPERGKAMIETVVRSGRSDARTRQNLALAQALTGEWNAARLTAAIDLTPANVDARVAEWAALATHSDPAWRTVKLLGIQRAAFDYGRPAELAWTPAAPAAVQYAASGPVPAPVAAAPVPAAEYVTLPIVEPPLPLSARPPARVQVAVVSAGPLAPRAAPVAVPSPRLDVRPTPAERAAAQLAIQKVDAPAPLVAARDFESLAAARPQGAQLRPASRLTVAPRKAPVKAEVKPAAPKPAESVDVAQLPKAEGGDWLVQLGSYDRPEWVKENWQVLTVKADFLNAYKPSKSAVELDGRTYYRLSVGRFASSDDAKKLCNALKAKGGDCFVRQGKFDA